MPAGDAPCRSLASVDRKLLIVGCDESVLPPNAETRLLKLVCRSDDESLESDEASFSTAACRSPP